ncbi:MAG TPA: NAD(P)-dependent oxidoreductase [Methanocella sp.]|nr:NAD(P)-dependent oxidoreductase [Methanocella sp.]
MIIVTGCGPLGTGLMRSMRDQIVKGACDKGNSEIPRGFLTYDFSSETDIARLVETEKPDTLILTEEIDNIERCERNRMDAMQYNTRAVRYFTEAAQRAGSRTIYKSTAFVFDGRKPGGMYTETDRTNPINVYGETKLMGEVATDKVPGFLIVRMGEVYGSHPGNFVSYTYDRLKRGEKVELARDMYFSPIHIEDAIISIKTLVASDMLGFCNVAGPERISHYDFGRKIAAAFGLNEDLLVPVSMAELKLTVLMPKDISLDISMLSTLVKVRTVDEGLEAMMAGYNKK